MVAKDMELRYMLLNGDLAIWSNQKFNLLKLCALVHASEMLFERRGERPSDTSLQGHAMGFHNSAWPSPQAVGNSESPISFGQKAAEKFVEQLKAIQWTLINLGFVARRR
jgi:hypothetical protein